MSPMIVAIAYMSVAIVLMLVSACFFGLRANDHGSNDIPFMLVALMLIIFWPVVLLFSPFVMSYFVTRWIKNKIERTSNDSK